MHQFQCDYIAGCHPAVLKALCETNLEEVPGYGEDVFCKEASDMIRAACGGIDADVHFLSGGTQTNLTLIAAALRPHQGVVSASSGHIEAHETGAIESTGHKVMTVPEVDGKVTAEALRRLSTFEALPRDCVFTTLPDLFHNDPTHFTNRSRLVFLTPNLTKNGLI